MCGDGISVGVDVAMARSIQLLRWLRKCDHRPFQGQTSFVETEVCFYFLHYTSFAYETQFGTQRMIMTMIWICLVQSFRLRGFSDGIGMRSLDFHRQIGAQEIRGGR